MRAIAICFAILLAGCTGQPEQIPLDDVPGPVVLPPHLVLHDGNGTLLEAASIPAMVADILPVGALAFEPTLGVDPEGAIFMATTPEDGVAIGFGPGVHRSLDDGATWENVGPRLPTGHPAPPETNDPYLYVDPTTGRVFQYAMAPILTCAMLSFSDDQGASWTTNPKGCGVSPPWDHQTLVAAKPRAPVTTVGYPNVLVSCVNSIAAATCSTSLDGGLSFGPAVPVTQDGLAQPGGCLLGGSLHGHVVASPDGILYLPQIHCGIGRVHVSADSGLTWRAVTVTTQAVQSDPDPAVAVGPDHAAHYAVVAEDGTLLLATSRDNGTTWSEAIVASPPGVQASLPAAATLADGRVVLAYPGTPDADAKPGEVRWFPYVTVVEGAGTPEARLTTIRAGDGADPLVRGPCGDGGRCPGMVDFIDVVAHNGTIYAAFVDACVDACATEGKAREDNNARDAILVRVRGA